MPQISEKSSDFIFHKDGIVEEGFVAWDERYGMQNNELMFRFKNDYIQIQLSRFKYHSDIYNSIPKDWVKLRKAPEKEALVIYNKLRNIIGLTPLK